MAPVLVHYRNRHLNAFTTAITRNKLKDVDSGFNTTQRNQASKERADFKTIWQYLTESAELWHGIRQHLLPRLLDHLEGYRWHRRRLNGTGFECVCVHLGREQRLWKRSKDDVEATRGFLLDGLSNITKQPQSLEMMEASEGLDS